MAYATVEVLECLHRIFLDHQPLLALSELTIPLPATEELWEAKDAHTWKDLWIQHHNGI